MENITVDVWLYGDLARFGGEDSEGSHAHVPLSVPAGTTVGDLLKRLRMETEERGITFINGKLSAMPGIQPDLKLTLQNEDRVAFFHRQSMWPFQYRLGASVTEEMKEALDRQEDHGLHHTYKK
ncbi:MAG: MoaD/ThiS family protein [Deltaproteobacteria bacterium]|nr:MoaD/ThiS family protein [Deltaproteobacteria bacterium]